MSRNAVQLILTLFLALFFGGTSEGLAFVQSAKFFSANATFASPAVVRVTAATERVEYNIYSRILHRTDGRTLHRSGTTNTPFLYVGQFGIQTDPNGLHHMRARYYNPHLMRFLNADPIGFAGGSNWYSYAGNSPLLFIDPTGLCPSSNGGGVLFGLFPTWGDYFHQVGQVFLGYADAAVGTAQGMANMAIHPIDTAAGLYNAVRHPVDTYDGMVASFKQNTKTNRGIGKMIGNGLITVAGVGAAATTAKIASTASKTTAITRTAAAKSVFPKNPKALLPELPRTPKGYIEPNSYTRIRPEAHALKPGETFSPRHHGQHYHVEIRLDPAKSWNNPNNVIKVKPPGYVPGEGTGFLPGETFPGL